MHYEILVTAPNQHVNIGIIPMAHRLRPFFLSHSNSSQPRQVTLNNALAVPQVEQAYALVGEMSRIR